MGNVPIFFMFLLNLVTVSNESPAVSYNGVFISFKKNSISPLGVLILPVVRIG